jgi:hypothetical protein
MKLVIETLNRDHFLDLGNLFHEDSFHALFESHDGTGAMQAGTLQLDAHNPVFRDGNHLDVAPIRLQNGSDLVDDTVNFLEHGFLLLPLISDRGARGINVKNS